MATATKSRTKSKVAKKDQCKECRRKLVDSFCWPDGADKGWHYRYCVNKRCGLAARAVRQ